MGDPQIEVRLTAATQSLSWNPEEAERTLESIEQTKDDSPAAFDAKVMLLCWCGGSSNLDW